MARAASRAAQVADLLCLRRGRANVEQIQFRMSGKPSDLGGRDDVRPHFLFLLALVGVFALSAAYFLTLQLLDGSKNNFTGHIAVFISGIATNVITILVTYLVIARWLRGLTARDVDRDELLHSISELFDNYITQRDVRDVIASTNQLGEYPWESSLFASPGEVFVVCRFADLIIDSMKPSIQRFLSTGSSITFVIPSESAANSVQVQRTDIDILDRVRSTRERVVSLMRDAERKPGTVSLYESDVPINWFVALHPGVFAFFNPYEHCFVEAQRLPALEISYVGDKKDLIDDLLADCRRLVDKSTRVHAASE